VQSHAYKPSQFSRQRSVIALRLEQCRGLDRGQCTVGPRSRKPRHGCIMQHGSFNVSVAAMVGSTELGISMAHTAHKCDTGDCRTRSAIGQYRCSSNRSAIPVT